jgi:NADH dehydrogenase FAD-containing subunit
VDEHTIRLTEAERIAVIGGGLVGVELVGELTAFADDVLVSIRALRRDEVKQASRLLERFSE